MRSNELSLDQKISMDRFCYLFLIFLAGCLIGWFYEEIFYWITEGILRNRGILYGPWLPIYGTGISLRAGAAGRKNVSQNVRYNDSCSLFYYESQRGYSIWILDKGKKCCIMTI